MTNFTDLVLEIIPGGTQGYVEVYEDDGQTVDYIDRNMTGLIQAKYDRDAHGKIFVSVHVTGQYSLSISKRRIHIRLPDTVPMKSWKSSTKAEPHHRYDGNSLSSDICVDWDLEIDGDSISVEMEPLLANFDVSGIKGAIAHARFAKAALDEAVLTPGTHPCWHGSPCGYIAKDDNLIRAASTGERLHAVKDGETFKSMIFDFIKIYREAATREVTVDNVLRVDTNWAPTQGGWPEATRLRVNYAVAIINSALDGIATSNQNVLIPLLSGPGNEGVTDISTETLHTYEDDVLIIVSG